MMKRLPTGWTPHFTVLAWSIRGSWVRSERERRANCCVGRTVGGASGERVWTPATSDGAPPPLPHPFTVSAPRRGSCSPAFILAGAFLGAELGLVAPDR